MDDDVFSRHDQASDVLVAGGGEAGQTLQQRVLWLQNVFKAGEMPGISLEKLAGNLAYLVSACLPLAGREAAKELLLRCFRQLPAARQRADRLGMPGALFPSWKDAESGSDSRHWDICGNASVAQAVFDYVAYTADFTFLRREGLDLLVGIAQNAKAYLDNHGGDHNDLVATAGWCGRLASQAVGLAGAQRLSELGLIGGELAVFRGTANRSHERRTYEKEELPYAHLSLYQHEAPVFVRSIWASINGNYQEAAVLFEQALCQALVKEHGIQPDLIGIAGCWLALSQGFAGMRTTAKLSFAPFLPPGWVPYAFRFCYRDRIIHIGVGKRQVTLTLESGPSLGINLYQQPRFLETRLTILR